MIRLWYRADRMPRPKALLPLRVIGPADAWCEDPADRNYNRRIHLGRGATSDRLHRSDNLYDLIVELDHNACPRIRGHGSAVFLHVARPGLGPTAGCVALTFRDLRLVLSRLGHNARIVVH